DKLRAEYPGILNWALRGCLLWQREGLKEPKAVEQATEAYRAEQDLVQGFIHECCFVHPSAQATAAALHENYCAWSGDKLMTMKAFCTALRERGFQPKRGHGGVRCYGGIGLSVPKEANNEPG